MARVAVTLLFAALLAGSVTAKRPSLALSRKRVNDFVKKVAASSRYSTFGSLLRSSGFSRTLPRLLTQGYKLTFFAPTNEAVANNTVQFPCVNATNAKINSNFLRTLLGVHTGLGYFKGAAVAQADIGKKIPTLTAVPLTKAENNPLSIGILSGQSGVYTKANILQANALKTSALVLHGIDEVLAYPYQWGFPQAGVGS